MKAFAAVFAREVFERRMVFLVGLCCGVPTLVASALHGWNAPGNAEVRLLAATVGGGALAAALALLYGASMIAGETAEKRISFYFSRPLPDAAISAGKLVAAVFLSFSAGLLVFVPGWLTGPRSASTFWGFEATPGRLALAAVVLVITCVLASHALVTVIRLRSPWAALDLILAPILVIVAVAFAHSLLRNSGAEELGDASPAKAAILVLVVASFLALLAASFVQVAEGRTDARRAHGAFSVVFFGILGAAVAFIGAYAAWCASAKATDLTEVSGAAQAAPRGPWIAGDGPLSGARGSGTFLFDATGGRSLRLRGDRVTFSGDGSRAAWGEGRFGFFERKDNRSDLHVADLAAGRAVATGLETSGWSPLVLSPSGSRLAVSDGRTLAAYDVSDPANPKQLAVFSIDEDGRALAFIDEDTLRLFPRTNRKDMSPPALEIAELSLPSRKFLVTGRFDRGTLPFLRLSADGRTFVGVKNRRVTLHDGRTGTLMTTLAEDLGSAQVRFLTGARLAVAGVAGGRAQMKILLEGEDGRPPTSSRTIDLGPAARVVLGGEIAPGEVAVSLLPFEENLPAAPRAAKLATVDVASGAVSPLGDGLIPANRLGWWLDPVMKPAEAGSSASSLFLDASGRLVRVDAATGRQTVLLGKGK